MPSDEVRQAAGSELVGRSPTRRLVGRRPARRGDHSIRLLPGRRTLSRTLLSAVLTLAMACTKPGAGRSADPEAYAPGLGEIMATTQMRHLKLWYAGQAGNWRLASYEVDELEEGFADAVRFHPEHAHAPRPLTELVPEFTAAPLAALRLAIANEARAEFAPAYDALTQGCNGCHVATTFSFNVVRRPSGNPYTNQGFEAPR